jgi:hypothetical protein
VDFLQLVPHIRTAESTLRETAMNLLSFNAG